MAILDIEKNKKSVDLPPYGNRNPDPITDTAGAHPIEVGVGAALGGAATGAAVGLSAGPVGAVLGAIAGAVAGGYAGKGVGELIDPTTETTWLNEYHSTTSNKELLVEDYRQAFRYGIHAAHTNPGKSFSQVESQLKADWPASTLKWEQARGAVENAFVRSQSQMKMNQSKM